MVFRTTSTTLFSGFVGCCYFCRSKNSVFVHSRTRNQNYFSFCCVYGFFTYQSTSNSYVSESILVYSSTSAYQEPDFFTSQFISRVITVIFSTSPSISWVLVGFHSFDVAFTHLGYIKICSTQFSSWWSWCCSRSASCTTTLARNGTMILQGLDLSVQRGRC